ncbi:MAG: lipopolysaccharide heptosyltransferase I, partial [Nitrospinaceae bacterium]|nr:lipopolysaccharide heptosyltransferase I [Nitrospinaceae bacterium]NIR57210.1 lipopolysaccharide heptosyltransferase I [Nitrospinaceae bacterium]NIS87653.1 lipopolysaccharide heptosyltransferase I [Nitrospinaceae bacterium]NIT84519.1 lipopolysaccharide heptosyltransferase I [Nitrospinaceae bacterium]NIU46710.1 lipopolysaccharide heptosyltransferase I [Nitrospinaceae bacterium]
SFSFPSVQASNLFALATVTALFFRGTGIFVFPLALLSSLSRLYLGVHYPTDIIAGALCGIIIGLLSFKVYQILVPPWDRQSQDPNRMNPAPQRILIIKLSSLGDVIHTLPSLRSLRQLYPKAHIAWIVEEKCKDALYRNPDLDELIVIRIHHWRKNWNLQSWREFKACVKKVRGRFDLVLDLQGLIKTGVIAWLTQAPRIIGFDKKDCRERPNAWFTHETIPFMGKKIHVVDRYRSMIKALGAQSLSGEFILNVPPEAEQHIEAYFKSHPDLAGRPIVAVHHGVGFPTKRWPIERFAQLGDRLARELGFHILLTWGPGEEESVQKLSGMMKEKHWVSPKNSLHESIAMFKRMSLCLGCDTGPMHLAAAQGVPTVTLFGPTNPAYSRPHGGNHEVVVKVQPCSFCHKHRCPTQMECMTEITVDDVFQAVQQSAQNHMNVQTS